MKRLIVIAILVLAASVVGAVIFMQSSSSSGVAVAPSPEPTLTPFFQEAANKLGLQGEGLAIFKRARPECNDSIGDGQNTGRIEINGKFCRALDKDSVRVIAHEYLHSIWAQLPQEKKKELLPYIQQDYNDNRDYFSKYLEYFSEHYAKDSTGTPRSVWFPDEMHSLIGSEQRPDTLPRELRDWYKRWIPNHEQLEFYYPGLTTN